MRYHESWKLMDCHCSTAALQPRGSTRLMWSLAQCGLPKQETHCGAIQQFFISLLICSHSLPQDCLWMCVYMDGRHAFLPHNMVVLGLVASRLKQKGQFCHRNPVLCHWYGQQGPQIHLSKKYACRQYHLI